MQGPGLIPPKARDPPVRGEGPALPAGQQQSGWVCSKDQPAAGFRVPASLGLDKPCEAISPAIAPCSCPGCCTHTALGSSRTGTHSAPGSLGCCPEPCPGALGCPWAGALRQSQPGAESGSGAVCVPAGAAPELTLPVGGVSLSRASSRAGAVELSLCPHSWALSVWDVGVLPGRAEPLQPQLVQKQPQALEPFLQCQGLGSSVGAAVGPLDPPCPSLQGCPGTPGGPCRVLGGPDPTSAAGLSRAPGTP